MRKSAKSAEESGKESVEQMTIDEAIRHAEQIADSYKDTEPNCKCVEDHMQLAEWLRELQSYRQIEDKRVVQVKDIIYVLENHLNTPEAAGILLELLDYIIIIRSSDTEILEEK